MPGTLLAAILGGPNPDSSSVRQRRRYVASQTFQASLGLSQDCWTPEFTYWLNPLWGITSPVIDLIQKFVFSYL